LALEELDSVKEWMHPKTVVRGETSITEVARLMAEKDIGSVLVSVEGKEVGMLTERDILKKVVAKGLDPNSVKAGQLQTKPLVTIDENARLEDAADLMAGQKIRRLPVIDKEGEIVGIVTTRTISYALPLTSEAKFRLIQLKHKE